MNAETDYHNIRAWLGHCQRPLLVGHDRPDGDALGAIAGMSLLLGQIGLDPLPVLFGPMLPRYTMLQGLVPWKRWDLEHAHLADAGDALIIIDTCSWTQLEPIAAYLDKAPRTLVLDHHATYDAIGTRPDDLRLVDGTAGAVCLLVAEWARTAGLKLTAPIATALFAGLATDCGWFRFPNTDARLLRVAADLVEAGAASDAIYSSLYEQDPPAKQRLVGRMLHPLELHADGRLAVLTLRDADFTAAGADRTMTEDLVNEARRLAGTESTLLLTEEPDGRVRANFRSKETLDVAALARQFGGGGHPRAAGARPNGTWDEVVPRVIAATVAALRETTDSPE